MHLRLRKNGTQSGAQPLRRAFREGSSVNLASDYDAATHPRTFPVTTVTTPPLDAETFSF